MWQPDGCSTTMEDDITAVDAVQNVVLEAAARYKEKWFRVAVEVFVLGKNGILIIVFYRQSLKARA